MFVFGATHTCSHRNICCKTIYQCLRTNKFVLKLNNYKKMWRYHLFNLRNVGYLHLFLYMFWLWQWNYYANYTIPQRPNSPDWIPCDIFLLGELETTLRGTHLVNSRWDINLRRLMDAMNGHNNSLKIWLRRWHKCVGRWEYFGGDSINLEEFS